eukprot:TRINITY_DN17290_c0_g1_i1.p1 TRINITY_DN17290_c0_g1~~TRINITY_DN17290_c0_g1_i1.p1  ORF type:complete len:278 (+),score=69.05 TRINITY_DN17290_c0_g1_i1:75-908(+)
MCIRDSQNIWPEMQQALVRCGWHNYSLFYRPDGFAVGYFETDSSFEEACAKMENEEVNTRWQQAMSQYTAEGGRPDESFGTLQQYFYLGLDAGQPKAAPTVPTGWSPQSYTGSALTANGLHRQCFYMQFNNDNLQQYLADHQNIWPEMQQALVRCGWHNYSLFYRPDGFAVGYFETDSSFEEACAKMENEEVNTRWQQAMSQYTAEGGRPDESFGTLQQYFYLGLDAGQPKAAPTVPTGWSPQSYTGSALTANGLHRQCFYMQFNNDNLQQLSLIHI